MLNDDDWLNVVVPVYFYLTRNRGWDIFGTYPGEFQTYKQMCSYAQMLHHRY